MWTEGRVAAGLGNLEEGIALLARVRGEFAARGQRLHLVGAAQELARQVLSYLRKARYNPELWFERAFWASLPQGKTSSARGKTSFSRSVTL
jgi:hypothetical protein